MREGPAEGEPRARRIELTGDLDRRSAEALALEIRALARRLGLETGEVRVVRTPSPPEDGASRSGEGLES